MLTLLLLNFAPETNKYILKIHSQGIIKNFIENKINYNDLLLQKGIHCQHDFNTQITCKYTLGLHFH